MHQTLLSVCIITFNHSKYIRQAIESVLMQKVNFSWELIIADDFSTDGTREILLEYKELYPTFIKLILQEKNVGAAQNWKDLITAPKSKYISYFEGDDYWIDPLKLQKQIEFLELNPSFGMSFHAVKIESEYETFYRYKKPPKEVLKFNDLLFNHYIPSCSLVFRREWMPNPFPNWFFESKMGDIPLELMIADKGLTKFFPEEMGIYRKHKGGITSDQIQLQLGRKSDLFVFKNLRSFFQGRHWMHLTAVIIKLRLGYIKDIVRYIHSLW